MSSQEVLYIGADWCPSCRRVKSLMDERGVDYIYKNVDDGQEVIDEMLSLTGGKHLIPTLKIGDRVVQNPSNAELIELLETKETDMKTHDVVMIGAGPAALTAAIYTTREDIETVLYEKGVIGGLAAITDWVDNYPGFPKGISGIELAEGLRLQAERFGADIQLGEVLSITDEGDYKKLETTDGEVRAKSVLIATGSDYKKLGITGEQEYFARGVHYCATCDGAFYRDKKLVVVGGGNSAVQEAIFLTRFTTHIDLLVRSDKMRASEILQKELEKHKDQITVHFNTTTDEIVGSEGKVVKVIGTDKEAGKKVEFETNGVFVFIGLEPNTGFLKDSQIELDEIGMVKTDDSLETTMPGVFAAGDVRSGATMQIASATGEGATAALMIRKYIEDKERALPQAEVATA